MSSGFPSLSGGGGEDLEEGFWSSFSNVMMVILKIFLLVIVLMALNNRNLLDDLKHSVRAKEAAQQQAEQASIEAQKATQQAQQASEKAEFQLKANASLEDQLEYLQQRVASLEMDLLSSRAETEQARNTNSSRDTELTRLQALTAQQADSLAEKDRSLNGLQADLAAKTTELTGLRVQIDDSQKKLLSLQGEYTSLDQKYQKLLRPARSAKGKQVAEVVYSKAEAADFFKAQEEATNLPYIYLSAGVSAKLFQETLQFAHDSGAKFNGVLCGRATWAGSVEPYIKDGEASAREWLRTTGFENIDELNKVLVKTASPWTDKA